MGSQPLRLTDRRWPAGTLLSCLEPEVRADFLDLGTTIPVRPGDHILREGEPGDHMVLLREAVVKVTVSVADGRQALMAIRVSGDVVGEISALNGTLRSATVTSCSTGSVSVIYRRDWYPFLNRRPGAALALARATAARFRWANRRRLDFTSYPAKVRVARILVELAIAHGQPVETGRSVGVTLTQQELASLCAAAEPTVEKALRELREADVLRTGYRHIVVHDMPTLRRFARMPSGNHQWAPGVH
ncbi:Crp/Fnr family transcriptional regulator [Micromonospora costi]|uniref:Crp/Fnr family transcriptional regulator n=1 Tax=Micromonospora costi TaxID=1530042 RepID=A0A3A9ZW62_9ACTN|nr:Crp/Fnr family transcriptional regulator [Micromonospora costi]RKN52658.1 Crp/Fnr family transcriptional regulator [Micromonospora costi]